MTILEIQISIAEIMYFSNYRVVFFTGTPRFQYQKKTANQPIRAAVLINLFTKKGHDWLLGGFSFWYWNWGVPVKKTTLYEHADINDVDDCYFDNKE